MELKELLEKSVYNSWTWQKLTEEEKERFNARIQIVARNNKKLKPIIITELYMMFLCGLGALNNINWRD